jgi:hypothetical protein
MIARILFLTFVAHLSKLLMDYTMCCTYAWYSCLVRDRPLNLCVGLLGLHDDISEGQLCIPTQTTAFVAYS